MRRLLSLALLAFALGCGEDTLGPVQTIDGHWTGIDNGYSLSLLLAQTDSTVSGFADIAGVDVRATGTVSGVFKYPNVVLTLTFTGLSQDIKYTGVMSATEASIDARLDGAGLVNLQLDVKKRKD